MECKDTQYGYLNAKAQLDPATNKCACLPYFKKDSYDTHDYFSATISMAIGVETKDVPRS